MKDASSKADDIFNFSSENMIYPKFIKLKNFLLANLDTFYK